MRFKIDNDTVFNTVFVVIGCIAVLFALWGLAGCSYNGRGNIDFGYQYPGRDIQQTTSRTHGNKTPEDEKPVKVKRTKQREFSASQDCKGIGAFRYNKTDNSLVYYRRDSDMAEIDTGTIPKNERFILRLCGREIMDIRIIRISPRNGLYNGNGRDDYAG